MDYSCRISPWNIVASVNECNFEVLVVMTLPYQLDDACAMSCFFFSFEDVDCVVHSGYGAF